MKKLLLILLFSVLPLIPITLNAQTVSGNITLTANASDITPTLNDTECGVKDVQFFNGAIALGPAITTPTPAGSNNYVLALDTKTLTNGNYVITAKASDKAGSGTSPITVCDGTKPNVGTSNALNLTIDNRTPDPSAPTVTITITVVVTP